jgi:hypothetical protein
LSCVVTEASGVVGMPRFAITAFAPSAADGCIRASAGVSVSIGLPPSPASASSTACISGAALGGCVAVAGGAGGGGAVGEGADCAQTAVDASSATASVVAARADFVVTDMNPPVVTVEEQP